MDAGADVAGGRTTRASRGGADGTAASLRGTGVGAGVAVTEDGDAASGTRVAAGVAGAGTESGGGCAATAGGARVAAATGFRGGLCGVASGVAVPGVGMLEALVPAGLMTVPSCARRKVFPHLPHRMARPLGPTRASSTR